MWLKIIGTCKNLVHLGFFQMYGFFLKSQRKTFEKNRWTKIYTFLVSGFFSTHVNISIKNSSWNLECSHHQKLETGVIYGILSDKVCKSSSTRD